MNLFKSLDDKDYRSKNKLDNSDYKAVIKLKQKQLKIQLQSNKAKNKSV